VGAETRGAFRISSGVNYVSRLSQEFEDLFRIGYEVDGIKDLFEYENDKLVKMFWAPMPSIVRDPYRKKIDDNYSNLLKIGFLGSARKNKGFDKIPRILNQLTDLKVDYHAFVQKPNFSWIESQLTIKYLEELQKHNVTFIEAASDKRIIDEYISQMDLLILPYSHEDYRLAGSGILFIASDFDVPVATYKNLGFAWDVENFNQGIVFESITDLCEKLISFNKNSFKPQIDAYNTERNLANTIFLF
jgi:glycosyltransferase involved in cell wall biosynthesis